MNRTERKRRAAEKVKKYKERIARKYVAAMCFGKDRRADIMKKQVARMIVECPQEKLLILRAAREQEIDCATTM